MIEEDTLLIPSPHPKLGVNGSTKSLPALVPLDKFINDYNKADRTEKERGARL